ncbi:transcriptional repressor DicA [Streptococcus constellatus]|uniref:Transcriptional repressor DicA n=1 Tax=Streptococcus constellatus TaxID=76860 RepID=A0A564T244_STRCV|nr:helix-turn-helix transcriptional regulator [Streptococcus constellatus]VUX01430.1 transcriptional repressor DicA [Streptococcus constellatus]VUX03617.1 transcriptional repressor DicA [Streptococcus gordonii]
MNRLKILRKEKSLSQVAFSKTIGIPLRTLQSWENGESNIKPEKAQQLADYFGVSVGYLLGYSDSDFKNMTSDSYDDNEKKRALQGLDKLLLMSGYLSKNQMISAIEQTINKEVLTKEFTSSEIIELPGEKQKEIILDKANKQTEKILSKISFLSIALSYLDNSESELLTIFYFLPDEEKEKLLEIAKVFHKKQNTPDD